MIGLWEMEEYGYLAEGMLPLTKETALELFDRDLPVYLAPQGRFGNLDTGQGAGYRV